MKRIIRPAVIALLLLLMSGTITAPLHSKPEVKYVASRIRAPFHYLSCEWAKRISPENVVYYTTREEAIKAGHRPCRICNP